MSVCAVWVCSPSWVLETKRSNLRQPELKYRDQGAAKEGNKARQTGERQIGKDGPPSLSERFYNVNSPKRHWDGTGGGEGVKCCGASSRSKPRLVAPQRMVGRSQPHP
jgi:hypothetical protein